MREENLSGATVQAGFYQSSDFCGLSLVSFVRNETLQVMLLQENNQLLDSA